MHIYKRSSLGNNKVKVFMGCTLRWTCIVHNPTTRTNLWISDSWDIRKLKRRMRRAGWIK